MDLCKSQNIYDFEEIVNLHKLSPGYFRMMVDEVTKDSSFDDLLTGELYAELIKLRLWYNEYKIQYKEILGFGAMYEKLLENYDENE